MRERVRRLPPARRQSRGVGEAAEVERGVVIVVFSAHPYPDRSRANRTLRFCGMRWEEPIIVHGAHRVDATDLEDTARRYRERLNALHQSGITPEGNAP